MTEQAQLIELHKALPIMIFEPLFKKCFSEEAQFNSMSNIGTDRLLFSNVFTLYLKFSEIWKEGWPVIARGVLPDESLSVLYSRGSLATYKQEIRQSALSIFMPFYFNPSNVETIRDIVYSEAEIKEQESQKLSDKEFVSKAFDDALANYYWCLLNASFGKRIGFTKTRKTKPTVVTPFYEFIDLDQAIPRYDELKALSFDSEDFLRNAPRQKIGEVLVTMLCDYKDYYLKGREKSLLTTLENQIAKYSRRLQWSPERFFENLGSGNPDATIPAAVSELEKISNSLG